MKNLSSAVLACFALTPILACHGSVSDPPEISVKENAEVGTTTDPSVRVLATHVFVPSMPDHEQFVRLELFIDSAMTVDRTTLFVIDPSNDLIATTSLKATREKTDFRYTISLKKSFLKMSTVYVVFKDGQTKRLLLGTTQLPQSGEQEAGHSPTVPNPKTAAEEAKPGGASTHSVAWRWNVRAERSMPLEPDGPEYFLDGKSLGSGEKGMETLLSNLHRYRRQKLQISTQPERNQEGPTFVNLPPLLVGDWGRFIATAQQEDVIIVIDHEWPEASKPSVSAKPNQAEAGDDQPATASESKLEGKDKPRPEKVPIPR